MVYCYQVNTVTLPPGNTAKFYFQPPLQFSGATELSSGRWDVAANVLKCPRSPPSSASHVQARCPQDFEVFIHHQAQLLNCCPPRRPSLEDEVHRNLTMAVVVQKSADTVKYYRNAVVWFSFTIINDSLPSGTQC